MKKPITVRAYHKHSFENTSIKKSLKTIFLNNIYLFILIYIFCIYMIFVIDNSFQKLNTNNMPIIQNVLEATKNNLESQNTMYKICISNDSSQTKEFSKEINLYDIALQNNLKTISQSDSNLKNSITNIQSALQQAITYRNQAILMCSQEKNEEAIALLQSHYIPQMKIVDENLNFIYNQVNMNMNSHLFTTRLKIVIFIMLLILAIALSIIISIKKSNKYVDKISKPIIEIEHAMEQLAEGNLNSELTYTANNELGNLATQMRKTTNNLKNYIDNIAIILAELSSKNYSVSADMTYKGMFAPIQHSLIQIIDSLRLTMTNTKNNTYVISKNADVINQVSESIIIGATTQSTLLDTLLSNSEVIYTTATHTISTAENVFNHSTNMCNIVNDANLHINSLNDIMIDISNSSKNIAEILTAIENISDQTALLSLNASIESARTTNEGKGFAVIAAEIRKLAAQTQQASQFSKELINNNKIAIQKGEVMLAKITIILNKIHTSTNDITDFAKNVLHDSQNQSVILQKFGLSVKDISGIAQSNTLLSDSLKEQADALNCMITEFLTEIDSFILS